MTELVNVLGVCNHLIDRDTGEACRKIRQAKNLDEVQNSLGFTGLRDTLENLYIVQGKGMESIAKELHKDYRTVNRWTRLCGIRRRPNRRPVHLPQLVSQKEMECNRLDIVGGRTVRLSSIFPSEDLCYILGFALGDGWFGSGMIELCNTEFGLLDTLLSKMAAIRAAYGGKVGVQFRQFRTGKTVSRNEAYSFRIWISNANLARLVKQENRLRHDSLDTLLSVAPGHFLAGLWDSDGCVSYSRGVKLQTSIKLTQGEKNLRLLHRVAQSLGERAIRTSIRLSDLKLTQRKFAGKVCLLRENVHTLSVFKASFPDWFDLVGRKMYHPKKVAKMRQLVCLMRDELGCRL